jgi:hypothetical protein
MVPGHDFRELGVFLLQTLNQFLFPFIPVAHGILIIRIFRQLSIYDKRRIALTAFHPGYKINFKNEQEIQIG